MVAGAYALTWLVNRSLRAVTGDSMQPGLWPGDRVMVVPTWLLRPRRGDIVVVADPRAPTRATLKRIVGLPGETVVLDHDGVHVDGVALAEPYASDMRTSTSWSIPQDAFVVLGDNRAASTDSRTYGPVRADDVLAVAVMTATPPGRRLRLTPESRHERPV